MKICVLNNTGNIITDLKPFCFRSFPHFLCGSNTPPRLIGHPCWSIPIQPWLEVWLNNRKRPG